MAIMILSLLFMGQDCNTTVEEVEQPATVEATQSFNIAVVASDSSGKEETAHKGVLGILVPDDWAFVSGDYEFSTELKSGSGSMYEVQADDGDFLADHPDSVLVAPAGMKWMLLLSDTGATYDDEEIWVEYNVELTAGETTGEFELAYYVTKNTGELIEWGGYDLAEGFSITVLDPSSVREEILPGIPQEFSLGQNYPNPFNPTTMIQYSVKERTQVDISVFDVTGRKISTLVNEIKEPGNYEIAFTAINLPSGMYIYRMQAGDFTDTHRMVLLK